MLNNLLILTEHEIVIARVFFILGLMAMLIIVALLISFDEWLAKHNAARIGKFIPAQKKSIGSMKELTALHLSLGLKKKTGSTRKKPR